MVTNFVINLGVFVFKIFIKSEAAKYVYKASCKLLKF